MSKFAKIIKREKERGKINPSFRGFQRKSLLLLCDISYVDFNKEKADQRKKICLRAKKENYPNAPLHDG